MPSRIAEIDAAGEDAQRAEAAEEVQRPAHVLEQEANGQQVEEDAEGAADAVVALAALAVHVPDGNLADATRHTSWPARE